MDARTLARIARVRALQLTLAQADEARVRDKAAAEAALGQRIAALADAVAPAATLASGVALGAEAHFRARLQVSAQAAAQRIATADRLAIQAAAATRAARQDQAAVDKLLECARAAAIRREMRALEDLPATAGGNGARNRHGPC